MLSNQWLNILIVGIYFVFLIVIGWIFRTFSSNTSDYFKGGGKMLWWMVGSTAFMTHSALGLLPVLLARLSAMVFL